MVDIAVLASGRGTNLEALLAAQRDGSLGPGRIQHVFSDRPDARALEVAQGAGVPAKHIDPAGLDRAAYDRLLLNEFEAAGVDLVVLAGYMRILSPALVHAFEHRIINIHPALLPSFTGLHGQRQALAHGVRVAGATTHFVDTEVDHGPIILQSVVPVLPGDTEASLSERILETEHRILVQSVALFAQGRLTVNGRHVEIKGDVQYPGTPLIVPEVAT